MAPSTGAWTKRNSPASPIPAPTVEPTTHESTRTPGHRPAGQNLPARNAPAQGSNGTAWTHACEQDVRGYQDRRLPPRRVRGWQMLGARPCRVRMADVTPAQGEA